MFFAVICQNYCKIYYFTAKMQAIFSVISQTIAGDCTITQSLFMLAIGSIKSVKGTDYD